MLTPLRCSVFGLVVVASALLSLDAHANYGAEIESEAWETVRIVGYFGGLALMFAALAGVAKQRSLATVFLALGAFTMAPWLGSGLGWLWHLREVGQAKRYCESLVPTLLREFEEHGIGYYRLLGNSFEFWVSGGAIYGDGMEWVDATSGM